MVLIDTKLPYHFADALAYVQHFQFVLLVHYFNINFMAIIPKATCFLLGRLALSIAYFNFNFFEHVLLIGS